jgi:hypothetical protein
MQNEMGGACRAQGKEDEYIQRFCRKLEVKRPLERYTVDIDVKIILKLNSKK